MKPIHIAIVALALLVLSACTTTQSQVAPAASSPIASASASMNTAEMEKTVIGLQKKAWDLYNSKQKEEYKKLLAPGFRAIYYDSINDMEADVKYMDQTDIKSYSFDDIKVSFPVKDTAVMTFKTTIVSGGKGKDTSGTSLSSAVWVNINGEWKSALYAESPFKAGAAPKK